MNTTINGTQFDVSKNSSNDSTFDPQQSSPCPLSPRILSAINNSSVYVSDIMLTIVNIPSATFAFLVNLVIIVTIIRSPSLHRPANVLLCSLANADCLTGLVTQPVYVAWRLSLHHAEDPCALTHLFQASKSLLFLFAGCTFFNLSITSVERLYAVSKPLTHAARVTLPGMLLPINKTYSNEEGMDSYPDTHFTSLLILRPCCKVCQIMGPLQLTVTCYRIRQAGKQVAHCDIQNKATSSNQT